MKNTKVLEMIEQGRIDDLKNLLSDEIYQEALKKKPVAKQRYTAMKKYFGYINDARDICKYPCMVEFEGKTVASFCNSHSLALTTESIGSMELYPGENNYPDVTRLIRRQGSPITINFSKVFADAKAKGYSLKKSEVNSIGKFIFKINSVHFKLGLLDATYSIIDDGGEATVFVKENNLSPMVIENDIGTCVVMPMRCEDNFIEENDIIVIEYKGGN